MTDYMETLSLPGPWPAAEHLLVCISPSSLGERLVRSTRRLADELKAEWLAVYVETPDHMPAASRKARTSLTHASPGRRIGRVIHHPAAQQQQPICRRNHPGICQAVQHHQGDCREASPALVERLAARLDRRSAHP